MRDASRHDVCLISRLRLRVLRGRLGGGVFSRQRYWGGQEGQRLHTEERLTQNAVDWCAR